MRLALEVIEAGDVSSVARVSVATFRALDAAWGSYVSLQCCETHELRVFQLQIEESVGHSTVQIDHYWLSSSCEDSTVATTCSTLKTVSEVDLRCISPSDVRVVQYLALAPASDCQPKLSLAFVKSLLQKRVLAGSTGSIELRRDGLNYGEWSYQAYFRGRCEGGDEVSIGGRSAGVVTIDTLVQIFPSTTSSISSSSSSQSYQPVGSHARGFRELVSMALRSSSWASEDVVSKFSAPHSLLLHAPSGAGKTVLVRQIAEELDANLLVLDGGLLASPQLRLEDFFSAALRIQPCVVLLEDLELLFPMTLDETKYKLVCRLVNCLESIQKAESVRVAAIGTVSVLAALHTKVRQLFTEEVFLDVPDKQWTLGLLTSLLPPSNSLRHEFLMSLAVRYGQKPSNITSIAQQICMRLSNEASASKSVEIFESEIAAAAREISSTSNGADTLSSSVPDVSWDDIGGLESVKQSLIEMVVWPLEKPHVFRRMGISPPLGMVLHGPPGTGKTMLAKATAKASGCNFLNLSASDLMKAEIGESEKAITRAFDTARALSPCMVFIDEFQSLFGNRSTAGQTTSRMISQLLMELDALKAVSHDNELHSHMDQDIAAAPTINNIAIGRIFVLAATNCLSAIDPAFLQPGRFENVVYVGLPSESERAAILEIQRGKMPWNKDVALAKLVEETKGANAATLIALCQAAAIQAMQRIPSDAPIDDQCVAMADFVAALRKGNFDFQSSEQ